VSVGVLAAVIVSSAIVRQFFGYSFATWRFHQRGLAIHSAHDVGWIADLTVEKLMRADAATVDERMTLRALRDKYPPGSAKYLFVLDGAGRYAGLIEVADLHEAEMDSAIDLLLAGDLAMRRDLYLTAGQNVRTALLRLEETRTEVLPVLSSEGRRVLGYLTEAYALRQYNQELERMHGAQLGEEDLFSLGRVRSP
jgi:chloride channel protein, CIC family